MSDAFDDMLTDQCDVFVRSTSGGDKYGVANAAFIQVNASPVPCYASLGKGRAKEWKQDLKIAKNYKCVFMRPFVDTNGKALSHEHWLKINGQMYDVFQIDDPGLLGDHLEVWCELVIT